MEQNSPKSSFNECPLHPNRAKWAKSGSYASISLYYLKSSSYKKTETLSPVTS
jgi:hypothetical protein